MARRMFTPEIVESDTFYELSPQSQSLYFHLCMCADDDGFVNTAKRIISFMEGVEMTHLEELIVAKYVLKINDSVFCIKHWRMHNKIRQDRKKPTAYQDELSALRVNENESYSQNIHKTRTKCGQLAVNLQSICGQNADKMPHRIGKDSLGEDSDRVGEADAPLPSPIGKFANVILSKSELKALKAKYPEYFQDRIERFSEYLHKSGKTYDNHFSKIVEFATKDGVSTEKKERSYDLDEFFNAATAKGMGGM